MYLSRTETMVAAGREAEYEDRVKRLGELAQKQPGFQQRGVLNSLSYPRKYSVISRWDSREAFRANIMTEAYRAFQQANPAAAISTATRPQEGYEFILGVGDPTTIASRNYITIVEWVINAGAAADYETSRKEVFELRQKLQQGFVRNSLWRLGGMANRYLILQAYTSLEGVRANATNPELQAFNSAHPVSNYSSTPNITDTFEVLQSVVAGR